MDELDQLVPEALPASEPPRLFDVAADFKNLPARTPEGERIEVTVGFPIDAQWAERRLKSKLLIHQLGRGVTRSETKLNPKTDLKIYEAIRRNGARDIDGDEAGALLEKLGKCEAGEVTWEGNGARVPVAVAHGITVTHTFTRVPTAKQARKLREESQTVRQLPNNIIESQVSLEGSVKLWKACGGASDSYVNGIIPDIHKEAAIRAVIDKHDKDVEARVQEDDDF